MAEPARGGTDGPGPVPVPARGPDPRAPGWAGAQRAMVVAAELNTLAVAGALARPDDDAALEIARLSIAVLESLGDCLCGLSIPEAVMEEERQRAFDEGAAACKAARCRLQVVDGGRGIPGPH
jgi:hypothetical protein